MSGTAGEDEARRQLEQHIEEERQQVLDGARRLAQALYTRAQREAFQVVEQAQAQALEHQARAREQAIKELEGVGESLSRLRHDLHLKELELEGREASWQREKARLEARITQLELIQSQLPGEVELLELRRKAGESRGWEQRYREAARELDTLQEASRGVRALQHHHDQLQEDHERLTTTVEWLRRQRDELRHLVQEDTQLRKQTFRGLATLDTLDTPHHPTTSVEDSQDLRNLTRRARAWMGSLPPRSVLGRGLFAHYYDEHTVRSFVAGMATSRLLILEGVSGTGKSSLPHYLAQALGGECRRIEVQSSWRDRTDLLGAYNTFSHQFVETAFARALYEAGTRQCGGRPFFILLDELNLSRVEHYFADVLSVLEGAGDEPRLELLSQVKVDPLPRGLVGVGDTVFLPIPSNVWFVGTANTDESTWEITRRVMDRAALLALDKPPQPEVFRDPGPVRVDNPTLLAAFTAAVEGLPPEEYTHSQGVLIEVGERLHHHLHLGSGQRLFDQLRTFVAVYRAAGGSAARAVDHMVLTKLLSPLKGRPEPELALLLANLQATLHDSFRRHFPGVTPGLSSSFLTEELRRLGGT